MPTDRTAPIRVWLASSRSLIRSGLSALLRGQPRIEVVDAPAPSPAQVDLILLDAGDIAPHALEIRFIVLLPDAGLAPAWVDAGASGILLENSTIEQLLDAIRQVDRGETFFSPELSGVISAHSAQHLRAQAPVEPLTGRESEVLHLLAQGLSNKDIAQKLYLSVRTVEGHLANIYGKIQAKSRTEAVVWAIQATQQNR